MAYLANERLKSSIVSSCFAGAVGDGCYADSELVPTPFSSSSRPIPLRCIDLSSQHIGLTVVDQTSLSPDVELLLQATPPLSIKLVAATEGHKLSRSRILIPQ